MSKKIAKQFEYDGLGFPIMLLNVPLINIRGVEVPDINYNILQKNVLFILCQKSFPLTGNEVRFIRQFFKMNFTQFANTFGVTYASVIHWENSKNNLAKITPSTELCIRLYILDFLHANNKLFRETFRNFDYLKFKSQRRLEDFEHIKVDSNELIIS
jgi:DNA-binding XRE family transcriptional regulator